MDDDIYYFIILNSWNISSYFRFEIESVGFWKFIKKLTHHSITIFNNRNKFVLIVIGRNPILTAKILVVRLISAKGQAVTVNGVIRFRI